MESKIERQVLWYKSSKSDPERHFWNFLIVNEHREIRIIKQNLYDLLSPIVEERIIDRGQIENSDLSYVLFCLVSPTPTVDFFKVYQGKVKRDRRLQSRMTLDGWNDFIEKVHCGEI